MAKGILALENEKTLLIVRKALISLYREFFVLLVITAVSSLALYYGANEYMFMIAIAGYLVACVYSLVVFLLWFYDSVVLTNRRVVLTEQRGVLHNETSEIDARDIIDVKSVRKGLWSMIFRYGRVDIETRSGKKIEIPYVTDPTYVAQVIHTLASTSSRS